VLVIPRAMCAAETGISMYLSLPRPAEDARAREESTMTFLKNTVNAEAAEARAGQPDTAPTGKLPVAAVTGLLSAAVPGMSALVYTSCVSA